jgi:hypothetical protein
MKLRLAITALALATVALTACGDSGGSGNPAANAGNQSAANAAAAAAAGVSTKCVAASQAYAGLLASVPGILTGQSKDMQTEVDQFKAFAANAPSDIAKDMKTLTDAYATFIKALKDAGYDPSSGKAPSASAIQSIAKASDALNTSDIQAAGDRVNAWFEKECK